MSKETNKQMLKGARVMRAAALDEDELALINRWTLEPLSAEGVFTFRLVACDDQVDRDYERFTPETLAGFAQMYPGKPVLRDHRWSADVQTARIYKATVEPRDGGGSQLVLGCFIPRIKQTEDTIAAIEGGLLRECSVGVVVAHRICSMCGNEYYSHDCSHIKGRTYDDRCCTVALDGAEDVYEVSLVPVPAQREAGVIKGADAPGRDDYDIEHEKRLRLALAMQELEELSD